MAKFNFKSGWHKTSTTGWTLESGSAYENTRTHFQSSNVQPEASLQPRVCRGSPSRRSCLLPPSCLGHAAVCAVRRWQLIASSAMAEPSRGDRLNRNITLVCGLGVKNLGSDFFALEERNPQTELLTLLLPCCTHGSSGTIRNHPHPPAAANPCQALGDYKQELFDQRMGWFLNPDLLGLLTSHISCLFRMHVLCSLNVPFQTPHFEHFLKEAAILQQTCTASWHPSREVQNSSSLAVWIDLALLLSALESSPKSSVWH